MIHGKKIQFINKKCKPRKFYPSSNSTLCYYQLKLLITRLSCIQNAQTTTAPQSTIITAPQINTSTAPQNTTTTFPQSNTTTSPQLQRSITSGLHSTSAMPVLVLKVPLLVLTMPLLVLAVLVLFLRVLVLVLFIIRN